MFVSSFLFEVCDSLLDTPHRSDVSVTICHLLHGAEASVAVKVTHFIIIYSVSIAHQHILLLLIRQLFHLSYAKQLCIVIL